MWPKLQSFLTDAEIESVPENLRSKLQDHYEHLNQLIDGLKNENEEITAVSERQQFQFEKEISESQAQYKESAETCLKLKTRVSELEENLSSTQKKWRDLQQAHNTITLEVQTLKRSRELLTEEKKHLAEQVEKRRADIERLNEEVQRLLEQAKTANEEKHAAIARSEEAQMHESNLKHEVTRLEQEKGLLAKQISDMNVELTQKNHEIHTLKKEKSTLILDLQSKLEHRIDEVHLLEKQVTSLKEASDEKDRRIEALAAKIRTLNESARHTEEHYQLELNAQKKLVDLYKKASEDNQKRVQELVSAFEEAQKLLQESADARNEAEKSLELFENQHKSKVDQLEQHIAKLKEELKHANDLYQGKIRSPESLESLFPIAAKTSKVLRSGMTLSQMYSEYIKAQEEIQNLKDENLRLSDQLKQILSEIEENTPIINAKMQDYYKALETIACLRTQNANALTDYEVLKNECNNAKRVTGQLERENRRLKSQVSDSNRQIQTLLKEVEEAKGRKVRPGGPRTVPEVSSTSDNINTAANVITHHLVTFRDIVELQTKNQQLLTVVRELGENQEQQEKKISEEKTAEFKRELQEALSQLEELKESRLKQAELVQSIVRQRDMYRVLLTNQGYSDSVLGSPQVFSSKNVSKIMSPSDQSTKNALQQLQSEFNTYKTEKAENDRMMNEQIEKVRCELSDARIENAKLASQLEYSEERVSILQTNMENFKKEAAFLRDKNQKHSTLITQHQQTIQNLKQELMDSHEKIAKTEVALDNVKSERDIMKGAEKRLLKEKESLFREQQQKSQILANLQAVQNNLERMESETKRNLQYQVEKCEKEIKILKSKLAGAEEEYRAAVAVWERQNKDVQQKYEAEIEKNKKLHEDLVDAYSRFHGVNQELSAAKAVISASAVSAEKKPTDSPAKVKAQQHAAEVKALNEQLKEEQNKVKALEEQLERTRKSADQYLNMCNDLELRVKEQDDVNKQLKELIDNSVVKGDEAKKDLEHSLEEMEKTNRKLIEENMKLFQSKDSQIQELQAQVTALKSTINSKKEAAEAAIKTADQARADCMVQKRLSEETQEKYERELVLHAENVKVLTELKEEHQKCTIKAEELSSRAREAEQALHSNKSSWEEREKRLLSEQEALKQRIADLDSQTSSLLHQLELIGTQMIALQSKNWDDVPSISAGTDFKDTQHLLQIIQYVKKEKEIVNTQLDSAKAESARLKLKVENYESELEEVKTELKELQTNSDVRAASDAQHAELLQKIEMMNLLTESNNLLRIEKDNLVQTNKELEKKVAELERQIQPLNDGNKEINSQLDILRAENVALKQEVKSWQSRTNQLMEQSHRIGPHEYKNLTKELEELRSQKTRLAEELQRKQAEISQVSSAQVSHKKALELCRQELEQKTEDIQKLQSEVTDHLKTITQVKKIGRKYKAQYDELKVIHDALVAKSELTEHLGQDLSIQDIQKKLEESEKIAKGLREEAEKQNQTMQKTQDELLAVQKQAAEKEDKAKKLLAQVRQRYNQLNSQKESLSNENTVLTKDIEEMKNEKSLLKQAADEENTRVKSQYEGKIVCLERELKMVKDNKESLERQYEELCQKLAQQQKHTSKPTAVGGIVERVSGTAEPLTANIKPLSAPAQTSGTSLRHSASPSPRSTPTASIRPMAIGHVASSSSSQARMAAVLPTTVTSATPSTADEDVAVISTLPASTVPQATVQPTPATATVAPTTVAPTVTPSQTPVISEVISHVSDSVSVESPAPTTSVIVSPPATQTQVVQPTLKRQRDDLQGPTDSPDSTAGTQKRVRMVSEGSQTNQQAAVTSALNTAGFSTATVVNRNKLEMPSSEGTRVTQVEAREIVTPVSSSTVVEASTSSVETSVKDQAVISSDQKELGGALVQSEDTDQNWEAQGETKQEAFEGEGMEDDEPVEQMEEFEDEIEVVPEAGFSPVAREGEEMADEAAEDMEETTEQISESTHEVIDVLDDESDNRMEADSSGLQAPSRDQCMAPPAFPVTHSQFTDVTSVVEGVIGQPASSQTRRTPLPTRIPMRQDRLPPMARQHLTPFIIPGQGPGFEEGDDSIVPSTPTLFVPRRTDGFAEAVSSPHVLPVRFLFSSSESSPQQGQSQLASQGAHGLDDTKIDLSQYDEGSGRTVPSTPQQVSPPDEAAVPEMSEAAARLVSADEQICEPSMVAACESAEHSEPKMSERIDNSQLSSGLEQFDYTRIGTRSPISTSDSKLLEESSRDATPLKQSPVEPDQPGDASATTSVQPSAGADEFSSSILKETEEGDAQAQGTSSAQNVRKPIVWEEQEAQPTVTSSPPVTSTSVPPTVAPASSEPTSLAPRARRMRYRGASTYQRGNENYPQARRGRGSPRRGRMF